MMRNATRICLGLLLAATAANAQERTRALRVQSEPAAERWIYSETVSPLDYAPVVIASAWSSAEATGTAMQLSIQCRRGRTDLVVASSGLGSGADLRVLWSVDDAPPLTLPAGAAPGGTGLSIKDDATRLLAALPSAGKLDLLVTVAQAPPLRGRYAIAPLKAVLGRMAAPCKWPQYP
jgi:hypothetical protein